MDFWVTKLREQAAQIAAGEYSPGEPAFTRGPPGIFELSQDLDRLAQMIADREAVRKALAHEVHHRVKNNLQIITSLLNMQAGRIANPAAREALGQTRARIGALALIHRILYEQDDDGDQATLDIARLIRELCAQFRLWNRERTEIGFSCEASAIAVPLDSVLPLALLAVEAVTNAYAYAFPGGRTGNLMLRYSVTGGSDAVLSVTDDGVGFDSAADAGSMGRQLMNAFAHQLGGTLEITSSALTGTAVSLSYRIIGSRVLQPDI